MNVLFVSMAFPPKNDPECLQTARYFKYLSQESDLTFEVLTSSIPTLFMPEDLTLKPFDRGYTHKAEIPVYESKLTNFAMRRAGMESLMFPDSKMTFHWQWKRALKKLQHKPDIIYSRSQPMSSAFMAEKLQAYFNVPWVMHLSDPWALSPLETHVSKEKFAAERRLISKASKITFTTAETLASYATQYPENAHKFAVTTNVFDPDELAIVKPIAGDKLKLVYTGGLAGQRSLFFLDDVLARIENIDASLLDKIEITVAGPMDRQNAAFFSATKYKCIRHIGEVPYQQAKQLQQDSHLLLVVDNPTTTSGAVFFPSKLLDYFLTGRKILAITPSGSVTRQVLSHYPSMCFAHQETQHLADFLISALKSFDDFQLQTAGMPPSQYNARDNAKALASLFRSIVG